jgi:hypothetical protein
MIHCNECGNPADKTYPSDRGEVCRRCFREACRRALIAMEQVIRRMRGKPGEAEDQTDG